MRDKKGIEMAEIGKILLVAVLLAILIGGIIILYKGKGGELLASIKDAMRFGRV